MLSRRLVVEPFLPPQYDDYDIHPNGRTQPREVRMVLNWFAELRRLAGQS